ncbi:hypothetical protein JRO89_XS08G0021500 [Xanthoceras sorbifolium]|uniref:AN1-type domain-containing protein n=1 Tax=Xanthoceras sorbifolium TaxID=99658 RepID=A0ABQ8HNB2_9ROSI|nr:hypothetical protein JRO89_XS08G0021500 [Xanthoceras sorbifolium]
MSWAWTALAVLVLLLFLIIQAIFLLKKRDAETKRLPPGPRGFPIFGSLHLLGKYPYRDLHKLAQKYGSIMFMRLGLKPTVVVSSPQVAELFLKPMTLSLLAGLLFRLSSSFYYLLKQSKNPIEEEKKNYKVTIDQIESNTPQVDVVVQENNSGGSSNNDDDNVHDNNNRSDAGQGGDEGASSENPEKRPANRCSFCRKRIGLTGFKCRCEQTFCSLHRYSDKHNCVFDYKARGRMLLPRRNPVVKADKCYVIAPVSEIYFPFTLKRGFWDMVAQGSILKRRETSSWWWGIVAALWVLLLSELGGVAVGAVCGAVGVLNLCFRSGFFVIGVALFGSCGLSCVG